MRKMVFVLMAVMGLTACNNTKEIKIVEPPKELILKVVQNIDGDLGQFVVAKNEKIKITFKKDENESLPGIEYEIPVKVTFTSTSMIEAGSGYNNYGPNMEVELLNKEGRVIKECRANMENSYTDLASLIRTGNNREEWIVFKGKYIVMSLSEDGSFEESKAFIDAISKAFFVRIKSNIIEEKFRSEDDRILSDSEDNIVDDEAVSSSKGSDCDKFLDGYERFMIKYIAIIKKYQKNPTSASVLSEYTSLMAEAQEWSDKTADCASNPKFAARLAAIQMKIANTLQ